MFKKILLPVDLTDRHGPVLEKAADLAGQGKGEVTLLHVIELIQGVSMEEERSFYKRLERDAKTHLERLGKYLADHQIAWRAEVRYGKRAQESVRFGMEMGADLIVLLARRVDPSIPGGGLWSVSYQIAILSQCPILLIK
jgi:nucleotide-binding universal stress UspA family protein